jgi:hypothetical protein
MAAVGIGLSISALSLNMQQAMLYTFMLIMPLMLLSGLLTPVRNMPEVLQIATYANPLRFGMTRCAASIWKEPGGKNGKAASRIRRCQVSGVQGKRNDP